MLPLLQYHYIQNASAFYVEDKATADALQDVSKRITAKSGHKVYPTLPLLLIFEPDLSTSFSHLATFSFSFHFVFIDLPCK